MNIKNVVVMLSVCFVILFLGCTQFEQKKEVQEINVCLSWIHEAQFAGLYWADQKGYYAQEGLKVNFLPYNDTDLPQDLVDGKCDFAILQADTLLLAREAGLPVKAIYTDYKQSPIGYFSKKSSNITKPEDLIGKTVGADYSEVYALIAMLKNKGIDVNSVKIVQRDYTYDKLASGEFDAEAGWITDGATLKAVVGDYNTIYPSDYNVNFYADVISTTDDKISKQPELVSAFITATKKGWQAAIENPDEAALLTLGYQQEDEKATPEHLKFVMSISSPFIHTGDSPLGYMDAVAFSNTQKILLKQGILKNEQDITQIFTNEFLAETP